jgi:hypothetical protein
MTEFELLRIITFLERVRMPYQELVPMAEEDPMWNVLLYLIKQDLTGTAVRISTLASVANIPYATAMRRIHSLIEQGFIVKKTSNDAGRSYTLSLSCALRNSFLLYARKIKHGYAGRHSSQYECAARFCETDQEGACSVRNRQRATRYRHHGTWNDSRPRRGGDRDR